MLQASVTVSGVSLTATINVAEQRREESSKYAYKTRWKLLLCRKLKKKGNRYTASMAAARP